MSVRSTVVIPCRLWARSPAGRTLQAITLSLPVAPRQAVRKASGVAALLPQQPEGWAMPGSQPGIAAEVFGQTLRHLRIQAGLSLRQLGRRALYDYTRLSRAER